MWQAAGAAIAGGESCAGLTCEALFCTRVAFVSYGTEDDVQVG